MMNLINTRRPMDIQRGYTFLLLSFFLLAYILPLGARNLVVPDEVRYAEIPREMIVDGDWVVPHLNGLRYFEKPVLGYWVHAGSILVFGENNFAVRLPSALAVGISALLIFMLTKRVCCSRTSEDHFPALLAVLVFLSCFEVFGVGNTAVLDSLFSAFLTASITAFHLAAEAIPGSARKTRFLLLSGLSCGLALLTKGFLAFVVPVLALGPFLIWERRCLDLIRMSWLPILSAALVVLPWGISIHLREPDFWHFFFWNEHIRRFMADNAQHKESLGFFFLTAPGMVFPWAFMIPAAVPGIKARINEQSPRGRLIRLSLCWLVLPFLFFSLSNGKLLTYLLPLFPPFAILMAFGLSHVLNKHKESRLFQWGIVVSAMLMVIILVVFLFVQVFGFEGIRAYSHPWKTVMAVNGLLFFILLGVWSFRSRKGREKAFVFGMAPLFLFFIAHFIIPDPTNEVKSPGPLLEQHNRYIGENDVVISDENTLRAVCWYLKRHDVFVLGGAGELDYGLGYADANSRSLDMQSAVDLIHRNRGRTVLIARTKKHPQWWDRLPQPVFQDDSGPEGYTLWKY